MRPSVCVSPSFGVVCVCVPQCVCLLCLSGCACESVRVTSPFVTSQVILFTLVCFHIIWSKMFLKRLARITRENLSETFVKEYERRESGSLSDSIFQEVPEGSKGNKSD